MSTPIWDEGRVAACLCAIDCSRCEKRSRCCVQLLVPGEAGSLINLCGSCFCELAYKVGYATGQLEIGINGKFAIR